MRADLPRQHLHDRFRRIGTHGGRSGRDADAPLQSPQPRRARLDARRTAAHRRNLPAQRRLRRRRRDTLRTHHARLPLHAFRLAFGRVRPALRHLHLPQQGFQPRGTAGRQHLRRGYRRPGSASKRRSTGTKQARSAPLPSTPSRQLTTKAPSGSTHSTATSTKTTFSCGISSPGNCRNTPCCPSKGPIWRGSTAAPRA